MDYYKAMNSVITVSICHCITLWIKSRLISPRKRKKKKKNQENITDSRHAYSVLLRSYHGTCPDFQRWFNNVDGCAQDLWQSGCSLLFALYIFTQSFLLLNFFSKIGNFLWKEMHPKHAFSIKIYQDNILHRFFVNNNNFKVQSIMKLFTHIP